MTTNEILELLEETDESPELIYIAHPAVNEDSDEYSGEEDCGGLLDNLNSRQLQAPAEVVLRNIDNRDFKENENNYMQHHKPINRKSQKENLTYVWTKTGNIIFLYNQKITIMHLQK